MPSSTMSPRRAPRGVGRERLVLLAIGAGAHAQDHAAARELIERGDLLGQHRHRAHGQHDDAGGQANALGARGHVGERDQRLVEVRRARATRAGRSAGWSCGRCPTRSRNRRARRAARSAGCPPGFAKGTGYIMPSMHVGMWTPNLMRHRDAPSRRGQRRGRSARSAPASLGRRPARTATGVSSPASAQRARARGGTRRRAGHGERVDQVSSVTSSPAGAGQRERVAERLRPRGAEPGVGQDRLAVERAEVARRASDAPGRAPRRGRRPTRHRDVRDDREVSHAGAPTVAARTRRTWAGEVEDRAVHAVGDLGGQRERPRALDAEQDGHGRRRRRLERDVVRPRSTRRRTSRARRRAAGGRSRCLRAGRAAAS